LPLVEQWVDIPFSLESLASSEITVTEWRVYIAASFATDCLSAHNQLRDLHEDTAALEWDPDLADLARHYVITQLRQEGSVQPSCAAGGDSCSYGENFLLMETLSTDVALPCAIPVFQSFGYNYSLSFFQQGRNVNEFLQLVWRETTRVGCGQANDDEIWYTVCWYYIRPGDSNPESSQEQVAPLKEGVKAQEKPQDLMEKCEDLYPDLCDAQYKEKCSESWGSYYGPFTYCPVTCKLCDG
jgi:hypothetical protein